MKAIPKKLGLGKMFKDTYNWLKNKYENTSKDKLILSGLAVFIISAISIMPLFVKLILMLGSAAFVVSLIPKKY